jgi:hypothetical protein
MSVEYFGLSETEMKDDKNLIRSLSYVWSMIRKYLYADENQDGKSEADDKGSCPPSSVPSLLLFFVLYCLFVFFL